MPKSEDKSVEKVFNSTELHFSEVTSFKIGTLVDNQTTILSYQKQEVGWFIRLRAIHFLCRVSSIVEFLFWIFDNQSLYTAARIMGNHNYLLQYTKL